MMTPIVAGLLFATRHLAARILYLAIIVLFVLGIFATFSRGGFIGLVGVFAVFVWRAIRRYRGVILGVGLCLMLGILALAPADYRTRLSTTGDASGIARQDELKRSTLLTLRHPLLGVGMDNYVIYSNFDHATHNAYTQVGSELGVIAMIIYILFLVAALKRIRKMKRVFEEISELQSRWFVIGLEASLIGYMISSFFLSVAYLWYVYYLVGYAICFDRITHAKRNSVQRRLAISG
jgi:O-antigen ligase